MVSKFFKTFGLVALAALVTSASAQYTSDKVSMYSQLTPASQGAASGNSCWGYVSPSGREYAIMGYDNKVTFVDITNPSAPVVKGSVPHTASLWADVKVHGSVCYVVSEANIGIQVIDMSNIDTSGVTLVRTITSPGRSHTIAVDNVSGFLYTCGSNNGTGTTTCFDLSDPLNPVQVGSASLTPVYMHEAQVVTYTSGPYAGRQIMFGHSEGRGLDIYDVTNKSATFLVKRVAYPNVRYTHQGWLSEDRKWFYVDDELDEDVNGNTGPRSLTRVFNVENLLEAEMVGTFSNGLAKDHNQYWRDGFLFQANYRSGLRIWDVSEDPINARQAGWFDTYPNSNSTAYDGAWSCYAFFPSNTVIISDINRGLFVMNVQAATTRTLSATTYSVVEGEEFSGSLASLKNSDDDRLELFNDATTLAATIELNAKSGVKRLSSIKVKVEASVARPGLSQSVMAFRFSDSSWQLVGGTTASTTDAVSESTISTNVGNFVDAQGNLRIRLSFAPINDEDPAQDGWLHSVDQVNWTAVPYTP
ncbi:MAG TPA: choice-of-anchor B family protein [Fimbriimonadaceae bacterium]|nr:choice-of-anchor B family protein [Fimbriimonadaceae bacterium]